MADLYVGYAPYASTCSPYRLDLIFLGVLLLTSVFCIFFNRYLPMLDVSPAAPLHYSILTLRQILSAYWIAIGLVGACSRLK